MRNGKVGSIVVKELAFSTLAPYLTALEVLTVSMPKGQRSCGTASRWKGSNSPLNHLSNYALAQFRGGFGLTDE